MNEYISTYLLDNHIKLDYQPPSCYRLIELNMSAECYVMRLQEILKHALKKGDDAIFIVKSIEDFDKISSESDVFKGIYSAVDFGIHFLLIAGSVPFPTGQINNEISYICAVDTAHAFVITRALFMPLINLTSHKLTLENFINNAIIKKSALNSTCYLKRSTLSSNQERKINVIIPFRNVENFLGACCESILKQHYDNFSVFLIDDCSTDNSLDKIPSDKRFNIIRNGERRYALANIIHILDKYPFKSNEIILILDGDDALSHEFVFPLINTIYNTQKCLLTYGSFRLMDSHKTFGAAYSMKEYYDLRQATWKASHLKTFKFELFDKYRKIDSSFSHLKNSQGNFYLMTYDIALMFPLLEVAGFNGICFVKEPLYLYRLHDNNDSIVNGQLQYEIELEVRAKKPIFEINNTLF